MFHGAEFMSRKAARGLSRLCGTRVRMLLELARSYLTIVKDPTRVMNRLKALYRRWAIPGADRDLYCMP
jgi:hypothetical protein